MSKVAAHTQMLKEQQEGTSANPKYLFPTYADGQHPCEFDIVEGVIESDNGPSLPFVGQVVRVMHMLHQWGRVAPITMPPGEDDPEPFLARFDHLKLRSRARGPVAPYLKSTLG